MNKKKIFQEIKVFAIMILVVSSLRSALADWNDVPTGSMKPTIQEGDRVVVNKLAYDLKIPFTMIEVLKWGDPKRGDIVVLFSPADGVRLVKRVVGLPGDQLELIDNQLFVNGTLVTDPPKSDPVPEDQQGMVLITDENLDGREHKVMISPSMASPLRSYGPITVPAGHYFVMGDNRDNSNDSRFIGAIERRRIVGRALAVAFSIDKSHYWMPRFHRFFSKLH
ncbi:MAG: signal peptidase I [Acidobacteria bacterium]|nr:signal peptidase I [Acidobacteriota bacterium]